MEVCFKGVQAKTLWIKVSHAVLNEDQDGWGEMDPFVDIRVNTLSKRTSIKGGAGKNPIW
jgi:hypothetical protein